MSDIYNFDVIVVGAGVIGIAIAMTCAKKKNQFYLLKKILVLEKKLAREIVRLFMQVFIILKIP
tara:strand:- start:107 stop:298 length:192 start_codon:yes stop_codon:yes gene_type:complete